MPGRSLELGEMAEEHIEVCGFLDVKFLNHKSKVHRVTKRTLGSWKVWNKHWCSITKLGPGLGARIQLDCAVTTTIRTASQNEKDNDIIIPFDAIIYRTQSKSKQFAFGIFPSVEQKPLLYLAGHSEMESQQWIANIRQLLKPRRYRSIPGSYYVSIIENVHSNASQLTGVHGDLLISTAGIIIKNIHSGETIENIEWKRLSRFHMITAGRSEDVKCICVIHTTKEYRGGIGELNIFCLEAPKLTHDLVSHGCRSKQKEINRRPLSLSEGDLRFVTYGGSPRNLPAGSRRAELKITSRRTENLKNYRDIDHESPSKTAEDIYQPEPQAAHRSKRISNISTASGIYEEIPEEGQQTVTCTSSRRASRLLSRIPSQDPPPLPPRRRCASDSVKVARSQNIRMPAATILPLPSHRDLVQIERNNLQSSRATDESNYVPMSPRIKDVAFHNLRIEAKSQDTDYVIMR